MLNRAQQSWPQEIIINLVQHNNEMKPYGRLRAMQMLLEKAGLDPRLDVTCLGVSHGPGFCTCKLSESQAEAPAPSRSPYDHELNPEGTACAEDCPACAWVADRKQQ